MKRTLAVALSALLFGAANAATFVVTNVNDKDAGSLRQAIIDANGSPGPDTVIFDPSVSGRIKLVTGVMQITDALTIIGPGAEKLTIDADAKSRVFVIVGSGGPPNCPNTDGPDYPVTISGLRLTNGTPDTLYAGGALYALHTLTLDSIVIDNSSAWSGGGAAVLFQYPGQTLVVANSRFVDNIAKPGPRGPSPANSGAGLVFDQKCANTRLPGETVIISNSVFSGNRSQPAGISGVGAGIGSFAYADDTISDSRIVDNRVEVPNRPLAGRFYRGAGISSGNQKSLTIVRSEITGNSVIEATSAGVTQGGGMSIVNLATDLQTAASATKLEIKDSTVSANSDTTSAGIWSPATWRSACTTRRSATTRWASRRALAAST